MSATDNGQKTNAAKEGSQNKTNKENKSESAKEQNNKGTNSSNAVGNGSQSKSSSKGEKRSSVSSGSTAPLVDLYVNPQKADVRKAFEEQTVKKYQDVFANIDLKKVFICMHPIQHLKFVLFRLIMSSFDCCGPLLFPVPILQRQGYFA